MKSNARSSSASIAETAKQLRLSCVLIGFKDLKLSILLEKTATGEWSLPYSLIDQNADPDECAEEYIKSAFKTSSGFLRQLHLYPAIDRSGLTIVYYAILAKSNFKTLQQYKWFSIESLTELSNAEMQMVLKAVESLRFNLLTEPIAMHLLPSKFTLLEVQMVFEEVLGKKLDRRNFLRKLSTNKVLIKLKEKKIGVAHKPPTLYRFAQDQYATALNDVLNRIW